MKHPIQTKKYKTKKSHSMIAELKLFLLPKTQKINEDRKKRPNKE